MSKMYKQDLAKFFLLLLFVQFGEGINFKCDFTRDKCGFQGDSGKWIRRSGPTTSSSTGPSVDGDGSRTGNYMHYEATGGFRSERRRLVRNFRNVNLNTNRLCVQFAYHMYGSDMGTFRAGYKPFDGTSNSNYNVIWQQSGNQNDVWRIVKREVDVTIGQSSFDIIFEAERGRNFRSDMAVDNIIMYSCGDDDGVDVMYPFGKAAGDMELRSFAPPFSTFNSLLLPPLKGEWAFFSRNITDSRLYVNGNGVVHIGNRFAKPPTKAITYIAPYYRGPNSGRVTIFHRETTNQTILNQITDAIRSNTSDRFIAKHAFIVTFISFSLRFQMALATNSSDTYAVLNYDQLDFDAFHVGMNERGCGLRTFTPSRNSASVLLKGNSTGVQGRHVFSLTTKGCFRTVSGVRTVSTFFRAGSIFSSQFATLNVLQPNENAHILIHVADLVAFEAKSPMTTNLIERSNGGSPELLQVRYGLFRSQLNRFTISGKIDNLFVLSGTKKSASFQYGTVKFTNVESMTVCIDIDFTEQMDSVPSVKVTSRLVNTAMESYVNVWLKDVTANGFTACAQEVVAFSGKRNVDIDYVAATELDRNIEESIKIVFSSKQSSTDGCVVEKLNNVYRSPPSVFLSTEVVHSSTHVVSWVKSVSTTQVELCAKSTKDENFKVHIMVSGKVSPCTNFQCPDHLECQLTGSDQPFCGCIKSCINKREPFCGSDKVSYTDLCVLNRFHCRTFGNNSKTNITVLHKGNCESLPFQAGRVVLQADIEIPGLFCRYVNIDQALFTSSSSPHTRLRVFLSVSWDQSSFTVPHDASASWSEDVTTRGFKACALVAGRHLVSDFPSPPVVHWTVIEEEFIRRIRPSGIRVGSVQLSTWYTGTQCKKVGFPGHGNLLITSIEHVKRNNYQNAMTVWTEVSRSNLFEMSVCARELQNFDGKHEGITVHWLASDIRNPSPRQPYIPEQIVVNFPSKIITAGQSNAAECKTIPYNLKFPSLPNPTVLIGGTNQQNAVSTPTVRFSQHDFAVWLEQATAAEVTVCMKSVNTISNQRPSINVNVIVVAKLCDDDSTFYNGSCYKKLASCQQQTSAEASCRINGGSLPIVSTEEESRFLQEQIYTTTWLNIKRSPMNTGPWLWGDGSRITFNKWFPGQPINTTGHNCAVMDERGIDIGWKAEHCQSCKHTICQKDAKLEERTCNHFCLNGGSCNVLGNSNNASTENVSCSCPPGFAGVRCQTDISKIEGCSNYTMHTERWRNINQSSPVQPNTTSCDTRNLRTGWHRFSGAAGIQLHTQCPGARNKCGTESPGWFVGSNPTKIGELKNGTLHFHTFYCADDFGSVLIRNCGSFLSYRFTNIPFWSCSYGLCTV